MRFLDAGSFLSLTRNWSPGDKLTLQLPIRLRTEAIKGNILGLSPMLIHIKSSISV